MSTLFNRATFVLHLGLLIGLVMGARASAAGVGSAIPSKSYGALIINDPAKLNGKISGLMQALQLPVPEVLPLVKFQLGFNNGFDDKRPALMLLYPGKNQPVVPVFLVPTTKFSDFQVNFAKREAHESLKGYELVKSNVSELLLAQRGDFAVLIPKEFEGDLDDFILDNAHLGEELAKSETWLAQHDASFIATKKGIRAGMKFVRQQFNQGRAVLGGQPGANAEVMKTVFDGYDFVFKSLEEQGELVLIAAKLDADNNVLVDQHFKFDPQGTITEFFAKAGPAKSSDLAKLPAIPFVIAGDLQVAPAFAESLLKPFKELMRIGMKQQEKQLSDEQLKQYEAAALKTIQGLRSGSFVLGQAKSGESILDNVLYSLQVDSAPKYLKMYSEQLAEMQKIGVEAGQDITVKEKQIAGKAGLEITQKGLLEQMKKQNPGNAREANAMYNFIFGNRDTLQQWLGQADETTLVGGMNEALLLDTLRDIAAKKSDFSKDADNKLTLSLLPAERHATMLVDIGGYFNLMMGMVKVMMAELGGGRGGNLPPEFPAAPSIGYALKMSKDGVETTTAVPFKFINAASLYIQAQVGNNGFNF